MANTLLNMKYFYRTMLLAIMLCASATTISATGHIVNLSAQNSLCFGSCSGSINTTVTGGVGPFTYAWASGPTTQNISNLCPGTHSVIVTDQSDMSTTTASCVITEPPMLTLAYGGMIPATCNMCNGSATMNGSGGVPPYAYNWAPNNWTGPNLSNACAGVYTLTLTDSNG